MGVLLIHVHIMHACMMHAVAVCMELCIGIIEAEAAYSKVLALPQRGPL